MCNIYILPEVQLFVVTRYIIYCLILNPLWLSSDCYTVALNIHNKQEEAPFSSGMHQREQGGDQILAFQKK